MDESAIIKRNGLFTLLCRATEEYVGQVTLEAVFHHKTDSPICVKISVDPSSGKSIFTITAGKTTLIRKKRTIEMQLEFNIKEKFEQFAQFAQYVEKYDPTEDMTIFSLYFWTKTRQIPCQINILTLSPIAILERLLLWGIKSTEKSYLMMMAMEDIKPVKWKR